MLSHWFSLLHSVYVTMPPLRNNVLHTCYHGDRNKKPYNTFLGHFSSQSDTGGSWQHWLGCCNVKSTVFTRSFYPISTSCFTTKTVQWGGGEAMSECDSETDRRITVVCVVCMCPLPSTCLHSCRLPRPQQCWCTQQPVWETSLRSSSFGQRSWKTQTMK